MSMDTAPLSLYNTKTSNGLGTLPLYNTVTQDSNLALMKVSRETVPVPGISKTSHESKSSMLNDQRNSNVTAPQHKQVSSESVALPLYKSTNQEKPVIPVIDHVITDQQLNLTKDSGHVPVSLNKVYKLLTDPHSCQLYERHAQALRKVACNYSNGFAVKDVLVVYKILNVCADRVETNSIYEEPLIAIVELCGLSYLKEKMSDDFNYKQIIVESISHLGYLMRIPSPKVRHAICRTLVTFFCDESYLPTERIYQPMSLSNKRDAVSQSDIAETMVKSLSLLDEDETLMEDVLIVLEQFSKDSESCCNQMLSANAAYIICSQLTRFDPAGSILFVSVNILWNLLENGDTCLASQQLANLICMNQLKDSFLYQLTQGFSHYHRQLRNDLITLANIVAAYCPHAPFMETGFTKQLCVFATFQEVKCHSILVKHLKLEANHEDFELKKILYTLLTQLGKQDAVLPVLSEGNLILALFSYVRPNEIVTDRRDWSPAQFEEIQLLAMTCLCSLCPVMLQDYVMCQGSTRILLMLEWCVGSEQYGGHGNSFHGTGGRGNKRAQMRYCLRLLRSVVSTGDRLVIQELVDQGAINQLIVILCNVLESTDVDDSIDIEMQSDMLSILAYMCEEDPHNKALFGEMGVGVVISYLKMDPILFQGGLGHHKLLITAIDAVWSCIVGCSITEEHFLEKEGICLLLDVLLYVPKPVKNLALGCLLDLSDNPKTVAHLMVWRGAENTHVANLLCDMWRMVEADIGVERDEIGAIENLAEPLKTENQVSMGVVPLPAHHRSPAVVEVSENMRAKIYSLFSKIGFSEWQKMPVQDYITLSIIEKYLDLKMGEVWTEIREELKEENVRPISPDAQAIQEISRAIMERNTLLKVSQIELNEAQKTRDFVDETEYYNQIQENNKQAERAIDSFQDFINRTSNYEYLKNAKKQQDLAIEGSRGVGAADDRIVHHSTHVENTKVTAFMGVQVNVKSTPLSVTGGPLAQYDGRTGTNTPRSPRQARHTSAHHNTTHGQ